MAEDQLFYVGQKALIEKDGRILVLSSPIVGADLPGGKIQKGELAFPKALEREVLEETGLKIAIHEPVATGYFTFHPSRMTGKKTNYIFIIAYRCDYISGEVNLSDEHDAYQWISETEIQYINDRNGLLTNILANYFRKTI